MTYNLWRGGRVRRSRNVIICSRSAAGPAHVTVGARAFGLVCPARDPVVIPGVSALVRPKSAIVGGRRRVFPTAMTIGAG
jgi:hypothetical protein